MPTSFLCKVIVIWNYKQELIAKFSLLSINDQKSFGKSITGKHKSFNFGWLEQHICVYIGMLQDKKLPLVILISDKWNPKSKQSATQRLYLFCWKALDFSE